MIREIHRRGLVAKLVYETARREGLGVEVEL